MSLTFESTHEYHMDDPDVHYNADLFVLMVCDNHQDRLLVRGIKKETMVDFARSILLEYDTTQEETVAV